MIGKLIGGAAGAVMAVVTSTLMAYFTVRLPQQDYGGNGALFLLMWMFLIPFGFIIGSSAVGARQGGNHEGARRRLLLGLLVASLLHIPLLMLAGALRFRWS